MPVLVRADGRAFHTLCRGMAKPWDDDLRAAMDSAALALCEEAQGACCAYVQSDEITVLLTDYRRFNTSPWFGNRVSKIVSVSASIVTRAFNYWMAGIDQYHHACFDARAFVVPREDVTNAFVERQQDAIRNSIQMLAQAHFSHRELQNKNLAELEDMLLDRGIIWADSDHWQKYGRFVVRGTYDHVDDDGNKTERSRWIVVAAPLFVKDRDEIDRFVWPDDEEGKTDDG